MYTFIVPLLAVTIVSLGLFPYPGSSASEKLGIISISGGLSIIIGWGMDGASAELISSKITFGVALAIAILGVFVLVLGDDLHQWLNRHQFTKR